MRVFLLLRQYERQDKSDEDIKIPFDYDIDDSEIKAQLHNGVMTIYMPKRAKKDSKKAITIQ